LATLNVKDFSGFAEYHGLRMITAKEVHDAAVRTQVTDPAALPGMPVEPENP
jgi:hypothetical protein